CYEGGDVFWRTKREPCRRLGMRIGEAFLTRLAAGGRSLYVGAGVAELPVLLVESLELRRTVVPCNLRSSEVATLNRACRGLPLRFHAMDAGTIRGPFDHLWLVSVLNDPERFPHLAQLAYGRDVPSRRLCQGTPPRAVARQSLHVQTPPAGSRDDLRGGGQLDRRLVPQERHSVPGRAAAVSNHVG